MAHDNPDDQHFHASVILGFARDVEREEFFAGSDVVRIGEAIAPFASAIHAYDVTAALTYVRSGVILPHSEE